MKTIFTLLPLFRWSTFVSNMVPSSGSFFWVSVARLKYQHCTNLICGRSCHTSSKSKGEAAYVQLGHRSSPRHLPSGFNKWIKQNQITCLSITITILLTWLLSEVNRIMIHSICRPQPVRWRWFNFTSRNSPEDPFLHYRPYPILYLIYRPITIYSILSDLKSVWQFVL